MKFLESSQNFFAMLGISSNQSLMNVNFFMVEFIGIGRVCSDLAFLIYDANSFREYTYSAFYISTATMADACFTILAIKRAHMFNIIEFGEKLIEKSEL